MAKATSGFIAARKGASIYHTCGKTFAATKGTPFYRRHYEAEFISQMVSLLAHGCPPQAIVATYGVDERTVAEWQQAAGTHCRQVHEAVVQQGRLDLKQVQTEFPGLTWPWAK